MKHVPFSPMVFLVFLAGGCASPAFLYQEKPVPPLALEPFHPDIVSGEVAKEVDLRSFGQKFQKVDTLVFPPNNQLWLGKYVWISQHLDGGGSIDYARLGYAKKEKAHLLLSRFNGGGTLTTAELFLIKLSDNRLELLSHRALSNIRDNELSFKKGNIRVNETPFSLKDFFETKDELR